MTSFEASSSVAPAPVRINKHRSSATGTRLDSQGVAANGPETAENL
jgi:hypothetical protein